MVMSTIPRGHALRELLKPLKELEREERWGAGSSPAVYLAEAATAPRSQFLYKAEQEHRHFLFRQCKVQRFA